MVRVDELLEGVDCRALVVVARSSRDPHIAPFVGRGHFGRCLVVAPRDAPPRLGYLQTIDRAEAESSELKLLTPEELDVIRWVRESTTDGQLLAHVLGRALHLCEVAPGRLAIAGGLSAGVAVEAFSRLAGEGWRFVSGEDLVLTLRKTKSDSELEEIRRVSRGTRAAFRRVAHLLAHAAADDPGGELRSAGERLRAGHLRRAVATVLLDHGLEQPEGNLITAGKDATVPHTAGDDGRVLRRSEAIVVDLFPRGRLFADCTRVFCVGRVPESLRRGHAEVLAALELARSRAIPGVRAWDLQEAVCEHFSEAGWTTPLTDPLAVRGYVHGLGHGIGFDVHEYPSFRKEAGDIEGRLEAGDVFTLEPGLYDPEEGWAVRLEDLCYLGPDGLENLTPLPYDLDPRAW